MKIVIAAGGTGGHVMPAMTVANELIKQGHEVAWIGTPHGLEAKLIPASKIPFYSLNIKGLRGSGIKGLIQTAIKGTKALFQSRKLLKKLNPDAVLTMGGYVTGPVGIAAWMMRKPLYLHEQNAIPGLTNRVLKPFAKKIMESFPGSFKPSNKITTTGNPIRPELVVTETPETRLNTRTGKLKILAMGGSQGALFLNQNLPEALSKLPEDIRPEVFHIAGEKMLEETKKAYRKFNVKAEIAPFINDMCDAYFNADLVIARAGALTVSEIAATGVASMLIPYPYAADDHQKANAQFLAKNNATILLNQNDLTPDLLAEQLQKMHNNRNDLIKMATSAHKVSRPNATKAVCAICVAH